MMMMMMMMIQDLYLGGSDQELYPCRANREIYGR